MPDQPGENGSFELPNIDSLMGDLDAQFGASMTAAAQGDPGNAAPQTPQSSADFPLFGGDPDDPPAAPRQPAQPQPTQQPASQQPPQAPRAPQPDAPQQPAQPQQLDGWRGYFQQAGLDVSAYDSDQALISDLARLHQNRGQLEQYAQVGMQVAPHIQAFQEWLHSRGQQPQQPQQQAPPAAPAQPEEKPNPFAQHWNAPDFDPEWMKQVQWSEEAGEYVGKSATTSWEIVNQVNRFDRWRREQIYDTSNPYEKGWNVYQPLVEERAREIAREIVQEQFGQHQQVSQLSQFEQGNATWLYQHDQSGQPVVNPHTGQVNVTPAGARFYELYGEARQVYQAADPVRLAHDVAARVRGEQAMAHLQQVQQWAAQQQAQQPQQFNPAQLPSPQVPQQQQMPAIPPQQAAANRINQYVNGNSQAAFHAPSAAGAPPQGSPPLVPVNSFNDLDDWFSHALRQQ